MRHRSDSRRTARRAPFALAAALVLAGCSLAPRYERPAAPVPSAYTNGVDAAHDAPSAFAPGADAALLDDWRSYFTSPALHAWIDAALANNRDLRIAAGRLDEARAMYGVQRAERMPSIDASTGYERTRQYDPVLRESAVSGLYRAGVGISAYELDLFGRVRNLSDAALAEYFATADAQRTVRIGVIAEVANAYVAERALNEQRALAERTLDARERIAALTQRRYAAGTSDAIELRSAEMLVAAARASHAALQREHAQAVRALQLLAGDFARDVRDDDTALDALTIAPVAPGAPSDLLERRPDIRQAESRLKAAHAQIGAARAAFFPRIALTTDYGSVSDAFSSLFAAGTSVWTFAPRITLPIFAGGRNRANLDVADARRHIAVAEYEKTVQVAFREVADAFTARDWIERQLAAQRDVHAADDARLKLAERRYAGGVATYLELLDAQRSTYESGQELIRLRQLRLANAIALYRALGGGWTPGTAVDDA
ncbi:efflux transporter outer membrane subunit [Burkholderia multivorans]|uniref:efflux transporter outer membrane subunit n=1 Tax=Burkholderia multivorans TaxID=87883 RepID=UPI0012DE68E2|nr:efflux transporter outer membrane subunit [Burkholderia multivorans]MBU9339566.1 efflux transporter outer membrane subunit [Burkholderia multivorans]MCA8139851.1 efflux transporter outer membrane subunit [Burkholderia multivorans]MCO1366689.1 efflux transporter outer membrane subunit [Burkholderia multivorans]MCO1376298.1 efflux transporter outer membrane subunit [Burkholderia multivorans]QGR60878.1 efflux transporter outer membrane subunit [Burkholderia multivorans]